MRSAILGMVLAIAVWAVPVAAHHSSSMFVLSSPIWMTGTIVRFDRINPHAIVTLEEKDRNGQSRRWAVEGPAPVQLDRRGFQPDLLKTGDVVTFCSFPLKAELLSLYSSRTSDGVTPQRFVHGHLLIRNGQKSRWGSYGNLSECIRTSEEPRQVWLDLLNSDSQFGEAWCQQRINSTQSTPAMKAFVEEFNKLLIKPCQ